MYHNWVSANTKPLEVDSTVFNVFDGEYPPEDTHYDIMLISGSKKGVYDQLDWMIRLQNYIRTTAAKGQKYIGICFGHQILAAAFGSQVIVNPNGWEVATCSFPISNQIQQELNITFTNDLRLYYAHKDIVTSVPEGFTVLGGNDKSPIQGLIKDNQIFTLQGHPEFSKGVLECILQIIEQESLADIEVVTESRKKLALPTDQLWLIDHVLEYLGF
eukprot:TRINITY_DN798_c0_g1_i1.p1 TRINITY_DN798_c0_g1~~TRINITY_DN798_c0_g1_i1.p1  ORF type:complete len:216 (-),score=46.88 TRINITY_DN798_c0_g1_i1:288-935(-)